MQIRESQRAYLVIVMLSISMEGGVFIFTSKIKNIHMPTHTLNTY